MIKKINTEGDIDIYFDSKYKFKSLFNRKTGFYCRTGILEKDENDNIYDTGIDPFMASFPQLIDIGIMGSCENGRSGKCIAGKVQCYQNGKNLHKSNMSLEAYQNIMKQCKDKLHQVALGGRGDVDAHEHFEDILISTRDNDIIPNFTTSGLGLTPEKAAITAKYCGAVAVSWYRQQHTLDAINMLLEAGVTTNIHYVLSNETIDEAIWHLKYHLKDVETGKVADYFPKGIGAVIFLLHKPIGLGEESNVLRVDDPKVRQFFELIDNWKGDFKIGFDSCSIPGILNHTKNINDQSIDTCEAARFSMYITAESIAVPCSFDQDLKWGLPLDSFTIQQVWESMRFTRFRDVMSKSCPSCKDRHNCMGGCPIVPQIVLCNREERK